MNPAALPLAPPLLEVLAELGFHTLTPIQAQALPPLLAGRDLVGQSQTGSGKTAAFGLPLLQGLALALPRRLQALVLCPTRELCAQVAGELRRLGRRLPGLQVLVVSGGQPVRPQVSALEKGTHVVVGTPGRVLDLLGRGALDPSGLRTVVLDEADRMLDMGFRDDLQRILERTPPTRQTVLFSATFPAAIEAVSRAYQRDPVRVTIERAGTPTDVRLVAITTPPEDRLSQLLALFGRVQPASALVFCNQKASVHELARRLRDADVDADGLQGDLEQEDRDLALARFRNRSTRVLVATDVAARGLDVESVDAVVHWDWPNTTETWVHRSGRTGRAGRLGLAVTFVAPHDESRLVDLERELSVTHERTPPPPPGPPQPLRAPMETLRLAAGRKDKLRPGDILGALTGEAGGFPASDVGKIEIHDRHAFVAVSRAVAVEAWTRLREGRIKGRKIFVERVR